MHIDPGYFILIAFVLGLIAMIVRHQRILKKISAHNLDFGVNTTTRVIRKNSGSGNRYFPQFLDKSGTWKNFLKLDDGFLVDSIDIVEYWKSEQCCNYIKNKRAEVSPIIEVLKEDCK